MLRPGPAATAPGAQDAAGRRRGAPSGAGSATTIPGATESSASSASSGSPSHGNVAATGTRSGRPRLLLEQREHAPVLLAGDEHERRAHEAHPADAGPPAFDLDPVGRGPAEAVHPEGLRVLSE